MQMIDVLKRLAELDAQNPNVVKKSVAEGGNIGPKKYDMKTDLAGKSDKELDSLINSLKDKPASHPDAHKMVAAARAERAGRVGNIKKEGVAEDSERTSIGQQMARDGITYSPEKEKELIRMMGDYMHKNGMSPKEIRYLLSYDEDYIPDQLSQLPRKGVSEGLDECGMMPAPSSMGMSSPHTPASVHITADSGQELSDMLRDIMSLAGMNHAHDHEMPDMPMSAPVGTLDIDTTRGDDMPGDMDSVGSMRSMIDKLNPDGDEEGESDEEPEDDEDGEVKEYDNTPNPEMTGQPPANQDPAGTPGGGDGRNTTMQPQATPKTPEQAYEHLMREYKKFLGEDASELVPGKFYVVTKEYGKVKVLSPAFDNDNEAEAEKPDYGDESVVAQWNGKNWNFDYMMEQGVSNKNQDIRKLAGLR